MNKILMKFGLIMISILLLQSVTISAEETEIKSYTKAQKMIEAFDIMNGDENGEFNPDANITRGDFALVIARTLGLDSVNIYDSGYSDVEKGSEYAAAIAALSQMKIFEGYENGKFYPNEPLLYEQAMKIMVSALGYGYMSENVGGFPTGYLIYAKQLKLTEDIAALSGDAITRGMAAQLVYNALDVKLMIQSGYGDSFTYEKNGDTILTKYHNVNKIKGTVTQTELTGLAIVDGTAKNRIAINDYLYECSDVDAVKLLGHKVVAYATKNEDEIVYISSDMKEESIITVDAKQILPETTQSYIVYEKDEKNEKKEKLDISGASVIYNGRLAKNYSDSDFKPSTGEIELIDADEDKIYEVVKITSYKNMIVTGGGMDKIYLKNGDAIDVKEATYIKSAMFETEENIFDISAYDSSYFPPKSVVSVAESKDAQVLYMKLSIVKEAGRISQVDEDGIVYISNKAYELNAECAAQIASGALAFELGKDYNFSVDAFGKIATFEIMGESRYGFLINCAPEDGISQKLIVRMLITGGTDGELKNFYASDKVKINDVQYKNNLTDFTELYNGNKIKRQIVRFTLNENDEITSLETAVNRLEEEGYIQNRSDDFSANDRFELDASYGNDAYRGYGAQTIESTEFKINGDCSHLFIAYDSDVDEKLYKAYTSISVVYKPDTYPGGRSYLYDVGENWTATAIVLEKSAGSVGEDGASTIDMGASLVAVDKVVFCLNAEGEATVGISSGGDIIPADNANVKDTDGGWNSAYKGICVEDLAPGSIIQCGYNEYEEINQIRIVYMPGTNTGWYEKTNGDGVIENRAYASEVIGLGKVIRVTPSEYLVYNANSSWGDGQTHESAWQDIADRNKAWDRIMTLTNGVKLFDSKKKKFINVSLSEVQPNDIVFTEKVYGHWLQRAIIYR